MLSIFVFSRIYHSYCIFLWHFIKQSNERRKIAKYIAEVVGAKHLLQYWMKLTAGHKIHHFEIGDCIFQ